MRIFLAGASGVIGRNLLPRLCSAGHTVTGTSRTEQGARAVRSLGGEAVIVDVFDAEALNKAVAHARPDAIIHQLTDLKEMDRLANNYLRIHGTENLVKAARAAGVSRIVAQSIAFAYDVGREPSREYEPLDFEGRGRLAEAVQSLEHEVLEMPEGVVLRYGLLYGPGTFYARDGLFAATVLEGRAPMSDGPASFVHVDDAALAAVAALDWPPGEVNIVDDEPVRTGAEWLPYYADLLGAPVPTDTVDHTPQDGWASNDKAHRQGWSPTYATWREGFKKELA
jgi:nucleoside-diphosphate-sugar epimerase